MAKAQSLIDAVDIFIAAHPWAAPAAYAALTFALQHGIGTAHTLRDGSYVAGAAPHKVKMLALVVFAAAMLGFKAVHTRGFGFIPDGLRFLLGGDGAGLASMLPVISRWFYLQHISYPITAAAVIMLLPNTTPINSALISAAIMLAPLGIALAKKATSQPARTTPPTSTA